MRLPLFCFTCLVFVLLAVACAAPAKKEEAPEPGVSKRLLEHARSLKEFALEQDANTDYAVLIDMGISSLKKRFFLVDLRKDSVILSGMCAHGECKDFTTTEVLFSNKPGSHCTSEGRYKIGDFYEGRYGKSYKLHGLDKTNDNALERLIVLHGFECITDIEGGDYTCMSLGCPAVSRRVLAETGEILDAAEKPMLMWIYK